MNSILDTLAAHSRARAAEGEALVPLEKIRDLALQAGPGGGDRFVHALVKPGLSLICEVKRASPSKGMIAEHFPYLDIARDYEAAGADAVSCLTEPKWFLGSDAIFEEIRRAVDTPMLRKDFTVSPWQIYQARLMGADAVLLICSLLPEETLQSFLEICGTLGLAALTEAHDEDEIDMAVRCGAKIIGVNNRNLKDFSVDFSNAERLRNRVPSGCLYVAESGVKGPDDTKLLRMIGADAALVGETLMRAADRKETLASLRREP